MRKNKIDQETFERLAKLYPWAHGFDFLPDEIRNTVANIPYRPVLNMTQRGPVGLLPNEEFNAESYAKASERRNREIAEASLLPELLTIFRTAPPQRTKEDRAIFDFLVQDFLDSYKYRIEDCSNKSPNERAAERKRIQPDEIPNLFDLLQYASEILATASGSKYENTRTPDKVVIDCPSCHQKLRVPGGKRLQVTCTRCKTDFHADLRVRS